MLENLIFSFEMMGIGLIVVFSSLLLLSFILMGFSWIFSTGNKKKQKIDVAKKVTPADTANVKAGSHTQEIASTAEHILKTSVKPEIIAASMGALLFARETPKSSPAIRSDVPAAAANIWAQTGRARALSIRQDFALFKRGKHR